MAGIEDDRNRAAASESGVPADPRSEGDQAGSTPTAQPTGGTEPIGGDGLSARPAGQSASGTEAITATKAAGIATAPNRGTDAR